MLDLCDEYFSENTFNHCVFTEKILVTSDWTKKYPNLTADGAITPS